MNASDQNSKMSFFRNEFLNFFYDFYTMMLYKQMTKNRTKNWSSIPEFDVGDFLKFFGCNVSFRKLFKLNGTPVSHPTAFGLKKIKKDTYFPTLNFWLFQRNENKDLIVVLCMLGLQ